MGDNIDSLIQEMYDLELDIQANELVLVHEQLLFLEALKVFIMFVSVILLYVANVTIINKLFLFSWKGIKAYFNTKWKSLKAKCNSAISCIKSYFNKKKKGGETSK